MNRILSLGIASLLGVSALVSSTCAEPAEAKWWKQRANKRQCYQQNRINGGVGNGTLTAREARRMEKQQRKLAKREARMRASGNGLNRKEARRLEKQQDQLSKNIYRQKHDGQSR